MAEDTKTMLKKAKELLVKKEYREAMKLCKSIIDKDKENYMAWVFTGAAALELGNKEQSLAAYQKAIEKDSNQATAWQGLAQFHERQGCTSELISVYTELAKIFQSDPNKYYDYSLKLATILQKDFKFTQAAKVYHSLIKLNVKEKNQTTLDCLIKLLVEDAKSEIMESGIYADLFNRIDEFQYNIEAEKRNLLTQNYLMSMSKEKIDWKLIEGVCNQLLSNDKNNELAYKTLLEIYAELVISDGNEKAQSDSNKILEDIKDKDGYEYFNLLFKLINMKTNQENVVEFKTHLDKIISINQNHIMTNYFENKYYTFINDNKNTIESSAIGLKLLQTLVVKNAEKYFELIFRYNKAVAYFEQSDYTQTIQLLTNLLNNDYISKANGLALKVKRYLIESYLRKSEREKAVELIDKLDDSKLKTLSLISLMVYDQKSTEAYKALKGLVETSEADDFDCNLSYAKLCYNLCLKKEFQVDSDFNLKTNCVQHLTKAIKINQFKCESFLYLGHYYKNLMNDNKKSLKCYQKTYELCSNLNICGVYLIDALLNENKQDIAFSLLTKALEEMPNCNWASSRLGLLYLKQGNCNEAIKLFYNVLRVDQNDFNIWECLAEAYLIRGSFIAALKSFSKALELNPTSNYSEYQVASIKQTLGLYDDAVTDYSNVLNKLENHIPSLKGLGETYYLMAKKNIKETNDNKYFGYIELSIKYLFQAIKLRDNICCLWKILGDCCLLANTIPDCSIKLKVPKSLLDKINTTNSDSNEYEYLNKTEMLKLSEKNYLICCKLKPKQATYWYDLGLAYYHQARRNSDRVQLLSKSLKCVLHAISLKSDEYTYWNMLALLYASKELSKPSIVQHCLVKSLKINESSFVTWTNLGVFYLLNEDIRLAHECFKKSQALEPEYSIAWIGQAFIAETVDFEQSVDLYRHAAELMNHTESQYGYGRIVCLIENDLELRNQPIYHDNIELLHAIQLSSDCLIRYCDRIYSHGTAYYLCGILLEKQKLLHNALHYYEKALKLFEAQSHEFTTQVRRCYARVLCNLGKYEESLEQYQKITEKLSVEDTFALAKIFYKLQKYQQAYKILESAMQICKDEEKSVVYTALGMIASKFNMQDAITHFYKSFQAKPVCIQSLFALCSIGLLKNDMKLIGAVFNELDAITDYSYRFDILKLKCIYFCLKQDFQKATMFISKYVHENPAKANGWTELCLCLKRAEKTELALNIGYKILSMNSDADITFYECLQVLLLQHLTSKADESERKSLLIKFQITLHKFPANLNSWNLFTKFLSATKQSEYETISQKISNQFNFN